MKLPQVQLVLALVAALVGGAANAATGDLMHNGRSAYGDPAPAEAAVRVVDLTTVSKNSIDVECGDVVSFRNGDKTFTWKFEPVNHSAVKLSKVAPDGFASKDFTVWVRGNESEKY